MNVKYFTYKNDFFIESGKNFSEITIAYHTYGKLSKNKDNVIWVCHALTANSDVFDWWKGFYGENSFFNPNEYFMVCANILGSCYGSTGPLSINPDTGKIYGHDFPMLTVRDLVKAHTLLKKYLKVERIRCVLGFSLGGMQALEWAIELGDKLDFLGLLATNAVFSSWGIALNESQRWAIENDRTWKSGSSAAGMEGMKIARSIALLSYRNYLTYNNAQTEEDINKVDNFKASSYQRYQGLKLSKRFNAYSYWHLTKIMDSHNVGRKRNNITTALSRIKAKTLVVGIPTDILFPLEEQKFLEKNIKNSTLVNFFSKYGHDGFLIDVKGLTKIFKEFMKN